MSAAAATAAERFEAATYRKITWRLMPFLFLCYLLAFVDRVNVGFAKLQMQQALGMSERVYSVGMGIFFVGYLLFEVPANMIMRKVGARFWIGPIMIAWGAVSACTMFVRGATSFYALRCLLGIVESGFFPGVILYLTFWFTSQHRAKMTAAFMSAIPFSAVLAGPLSGWILGRMNTAGRLAAWQWLFLLEGIPSLIVGAATLYFLVDGPAKAKWLSKEQKALLTANLEREEELKRQAGEGKHRAADAFRSPQVWMLCFIYFGINMGSYGLNFWLPQIIKDTITTDTFKIGLISVIPWGTAAIAMLIGGHHSDVTGERRWHVAGGLFVGAAAFAVSAIPGIPPAAGIAALSLAAGGIICANAIVWSLPTALLSGAAAAAGIAWINSVGNLGGLASPIIVAWIREKAHSMSDLGGFLSPTLVGWIRNNNMFAALLVLSACALAAGLVTLVVTRKRPAPSVE